MKLVVKSYVLFEEPGSFYSEAFFRVTRTRMPQKIRVPKGVFRFSFTDVASCEAVVKSGKRKKKVELVSAPFNPSPRYYYGGKVFTTQEIRRKFSKSPSLMKMVGGHSSRKRWIRCRTGNWQHFERGDVLIPERRK